MVKLEINNSFTLISNLDAKQEKLLRDILSYEINPQTAYFSSARHTKRCLLSPRGEFPTGLLYLVQDFLKTHRIPCQSSDRRECPEPSQSSFNLSMRLTPYPEQENAAMACLERNRGIVVAPTGFGKSLMIALIISKIKVKTLIVVPTLELKRQLTETLKGCFDCSVGETKENPMITVENVDALDPKDKVHQYDCVIIDEFHHSAAKTYRTLNKYAWKDVFYRFGLTATPFRSQDNEKLLLESILSEVIYEVTYKTAVDKGYIVPMEAYYYDLPKSEIEGNEMNWHSVYEELVVANGYRNRCIGELLTSLNHAAVSTLALVKEIDHGEILSASSGFAFVQGSQEGKSALIDFFNKGLMRVLVGTTGVLGEGVDTKPAEYIIIAGLGKSKNAFMQQCGRGFRRHGNKESCKIIIFRDVSHKWTLAHFRAQVKILKDEYGVVPAKLDLPVEYTLTYVPS